MLTFPRGRPLDRAARVRSRDRARRDAQRGASCRRRGEVQSWTHVPEAQAPAMMPQIEAAIEATKADPRIREGLERRGVTNVDDVHVETWPFGGLLPAAR